MTKEELLILEDLCSMETIKLFKFMKKYLNRYEFKAFSGGKNHFVAWGGEIALVAHLDTVFPELPGQLFYDKDKDTILAAGTGAGFDDRAGVYAIVEILKRVSNLGIPLPTVILTLGEEDYGIGAQEAGKEYQNAEFNLKYMIELDRAGKDDCVFYQCTNQKFKNYVASFDFKEQPGSYTDITFLMEDLQICGVNLSVGYYNEHTNYECLRPTYLEFTICKVVNMLQDVKNAEKFEYEAKEHKQGYICNRCHNLYPMDGLIKVNTLKGEKAYCVNCLLESCGYCKKCKNLFDEEETDICPVCGEENN